MTIKDPISGKEFLKVYASGQKEFKGEYWLPTIEDGKLDGNTFENLTLLKINLNKKVSMKAVQIKNSELKELFSEKNNWDKSVFRRVKIIKSTFEKSSLKETTFENCELEKTNFDDADMTKMKFISCTQKGNEFTGAKLSSASFEKAELKDITFVKTICEGANFSGSSLSYSKNDYTRIISEIKAAKAIFTGCKWNADFNFCDLTNANFQNSHLEKCTFNSCNLKGANFSNANLCNVEFDDNKNIDAAIFKGAKYNAKTKFPKGFDPIAKDMILEGKAPAPIKAKPRVESKLSKDAFLKEFGSIKVAKENSYLEDCKSPQTKGTPKKWPSMFEGKLYNIGFIRSQIKVEKAEFKWDNLAEDLKLAQSFADALKGVYESSSRDVPYIPFVVAPTREDEDEWKDMDLIYNGFYLTEKFDDQLGYFEEIDLKKEKNIFRPKLEDDEDREELGKKEEKIYLKASELMKNSLKGLSMNKVKEHRHNLDMDSLLFGNPNEPEYFTIHPIFWAGKSKTGNFVGVFTVRYEMT